HSSVPHRLLHSFPTRRSSDLIGAARYTGYDFHQTYSFLNPRAGVIWNVTSAWNAFGSYARTRTEPILAELYRADDPTAVPLFRRSEEHTSELQSQSNLVCRLL